MNESLKEFLKKLSEDEELCAKLESAGDSDKAYEIAKTIQEGFTKEEFVDAMTRINNSISADGEINDDDLISVAGGLTTDEETLLMDGTFLGSAIVAASSAGAV